jgi:hypothetical protein
MAKEIKAGSPTVSDVYVPTAIKVEKKKKKKSTTEIMPVEVTEKFIRVRVKDPKGYDVNSFRTIVISESQGITAVIGCPKGSFKNKKCEVGTEVQTYLFDKNKWDEAKAKEWVDQKKASEPHMFSYDSEREFAFDGKRECEMQILPFGKWDHPAYGEIKLDKAALDEFVNNFNDDLRRDLPITEGHEVGEEEKPAIGWFRKLINKGSEGLWAVVEWTDQGMELLKDKAYKYFSPEFYTTYKDPETGKTFKNVLVGGALTNKPYFKGMQAVVLSESGLSKMKKEDLKKKVEEKMSEYKDPITEDVIKDNPKADKEKTGQMVADAMSEMCDEVTQEVMDEMGGEDGDNWGDDNAVNASIQKHWDGQKDKAKKSVLDKLQHEGDGDGTTHDGGTKTDPSQMSEVELKEYLKGKKVMSESDLKMLRDTAAAGVKAMAEIRKMKIGEYIEKFVFSEKNDKGVILPKSKDKFVAFMETLSEVQEKAFKEILQAMPQGQLFKEIGSGDDNGITSAAEQLLKFADDAMKADPKLTVKAAYKKAFAEHPELAGNVAKESNEKVPMVA